MAAKVSYWQTRNLKVQQTIAAKTEAELNKQLQVMYKKAMLSTKSNFEVVYNKVQRMIADGREPSPALLYNLDKYWQMEVELKKVLRELGDKESALMVSKFQVAYADIYNGLALPSTSVYHTISKESALAAINQTWMVDGKHFSQRIWQNQEKIAKVLNENLTNYIVNGRTTKNLTDMIAEEFGVGFRRAKTIVATEMNHIQTTAARQRYQDAGISEYEFYADTDNDTCDDCGALDGKQFLLTEGIAGINMPPIHPNCRCCIVPIIKN